MEMNGPFIKQKILIVVDCFANLRAGGAERQIYELVKGIDHKRYYVAVVSLECGSVADEKSFQGIDVPLFRFPVKRVYGLSGILQGFNFFRFLRREKFDVVMTYHFSADIWGAFWAHWAGVPLIISNRRDMGFWRGKAHIMAYKFINRWVHKIVVNAQAIKEKFVQEEKLAESKCVVIHNGIAPSEETGVVSRADFGLAQDDMVIMQVANLTPVKGYDFALQAMARLVKRFANVKLVIIGRDGMNGVLQKLASELGIEKKVLFLGARADARALLNLADVGLLTSQSEGLSNAIMEYMAAGKAVVATNVGGNGELVIDKETGFLVSYGNVDELEGALTHLILSESLRKQMGQAGFERIKVNFSIEKMVEKYEELLKG